MKMGDVKLLSLCESCISPSKFPQIAVLLSLLIFKSNWSFSTITFTNRKKKENRGDFSKIILYPEHCQATPYLILVNTIFLELPRPLTKMMEYIQAFYFIQIFFI